MYPSEYATYGLYEVGCTLCSVSHWIHFVLFNVSVHLYRNLILLTYVCTYVGRHNTFMDLKCTV